MRRCWGRNDERLRLSVVVKTDPVGHANVQEEAVSLFSIKRGNPFPRQDKEITDLRAKLQAAVGIAQKFAEAARDACIAGLAQSAKLRQAEVRIAELEAEVDRLRQERLDYSSVTTTEGLNCSEWIWRTGAAERKAKAAARTATVDALRWAANNEQGYLDRGAWTAESDDDYINRGLAALLMEEEK